MTEREHSMSEPDGRSQRAVYVISVAAELAGVHPQTLRFYERRGLVHPHRTAGNTRRYSEHDIELLRQIHDLTQDQGINLAGVKLIMELQAELEALRRRTALLQARLRATRRASAAGGLPNATGALVPIRDVRPLPWEEAR